MSRKKQEGRDRDGLRGDIHAAHVGVKQGRFVLPMRYLPTSKTRTWRFWAGIRRGGNRSV